MEMETNKEFSTAAKVWMIICIVASFLAAAVNLVTLHLFLFLVGVAGAVLYLFLLRRKDKVFFFAICGVVAITMIVNLAGGQGLASFSGILNPVITYVLTRKTLFE